MPSSARKKKTFRIHAIGFVSGLYVFFSWHGRNRDLPSFPTRRSSDLPVPRCRRTARPRTTSAHCRFAASPGVHRQSHARTSFRITFVLPTQSRVPAEDRKSTRLNSSHVETSYAVFC